MTVHDRFQVGDNLASGFDSGWRSFQEARNRAQTLVGQLEHPEGVIWIFDLMARRGCNQEWQVTQEGRCEVVGLRD
jgi:hypothetical protein